MRLPKNLLSDTYRPPAVYLCQTNKDRIGELTVGDFNGTFKWNAYNEISISVDRELCNIVNGTIGINPYYDLVEALRLLEVEGFGFFQLQDPDVESDGIKETKSINAYSLEYDLSNRYLENFIINKGVAGSIDGVQLYNVNDTERSLLHCIIKEKAPDWRIGHVDATLATERRSFDIDRESVYDFLMNEVAPTFKCVVIFDTYDSTINIYAEETAGDDTDVIISFDNLASKINVKYSADDIKTVLTVTGSEDLDIREINYGLAYITDLSYYHTVEWMGEHLYNAYNNYLQVLAAHQQLYLNYSTEARRLNDVITDLKNHVGENVNQVKLNHFLQFLTAYYKDNAINAEKMSELDSDFTYLPKNDWETFKIILNGDGYTDGEKENAIMAILALIWKDYGLNNLKTYESSYKEVQTAQTGNGMSDPNDDMYYQYHANFMMLDSCQKAIIIRENSISESQSELKLVNEEIAKIIEKVSMNSNFTQEDIIRLAPFLREDEYNDDNFVITDVDTEKEIQETKEALLKAGYVELHKLSRPKLSFSTSIANLFALDEFAPIIHQFQLGNMIRVELRSNYVKKSRLMEVNINFHDLSDFDVTFGDLLSIRDAADIHADLLASAISAGKSVAKNSYNWQKGSDTANSLQTAINQGLLDAATEIKSMDGTQAVSIDKYGIHLKKIENGITDPEQGWIVSNKFLYTDDNWKTTKSVFGKYKHNGEEKWGVISEALIGGYIEGTEIQGGSLKIGPRGDGTYALVANSDGTVQINAWGGELATTLENIESTTYDAIVSASTTPIFNESVQSTTLTCTVYRNNLVVTPENATYTWIRTSNNPTGDESWNALHKNLTKNTLELTGEDIEYSAQFTCEVNIP